MIDFNQPSTEEFFVVEIADGHRYQISLFNFNLILISTVRLPMILRVSQRVFLILNTYFWIQSILLAKHLLFFALLVLKNGKYCSFSIIY